jgi:hypothetical protein
MSDAKIQVQHNVFHRACSRIRTRATWAWKIVLRCFLPWTLYVTQISLDAKTKAPYNVSRCALFGICTRPTPAWKIVHRYFTPRTHPYTDVIRRSIRMQKHKFSVTCPDAIFMGSALDPPEHEKKCVTVLCPGCTQKHCMSHRWCRM